MPTIQKKPLKKSPVAKKPLPKLQIVNPTKEVENMKTLTRALELLEENTDLKVKLKEKDLRINDLQLEIVSLQDIVKNHDEETQILKNEFLEIKEQHQDEVSNHNYEVRELKEANSELQTQMVYLEKRANDFRGQTERVFKLRDAMTLRDEFKIEFIIANFERMTLSSLEKSVL